MHTRLLPLVLLLMACDSRTPDSECPTDFWSVFDGKTACAGQNQCFNYACGSWCQCKDGFWVCVALECSDLIVSPDVGSDMSSPRDLAVDTPWLADSSSPTDLGPALDAGDACDPGDDHCGAGLKCCVTGGGPPWKFDAAPPPSHTCVAPRSDGTCPPPPP